MPVSACRRYTDAFKTEAVRLVSESGRPAAHVTLLPPSDFPPHGWRVMQGLGVGKRIAAHALTALPSE
jgi:hypothetical protein